MTIPARSSFIRPIELRKDLANVADLIERCFFETMDDEGRDYVRNVRQIARGLGGLYLERTTPESSPLPFHGYVWVEDGKIIGNLTLIVVRRLSRQTYLIANVAVTPEHRGRGIAQALTQRALEHIRSNGGKKVLLQVRDDNPAAQHIYYSNGFSEDFRRTTWVFDRQADSKISIEPEVKISRRKKDDWVQQRAWLEELYPKGVAWNLPFDLARMRPGFWTWMNVFMMGGSTSTWTARQNGKLLGSATYESGLESVDFIWLASSPAYEQNAFAQLLPYVIKRAINPRRLHVNYPYLRAEEAFLSTGFRKQNTLIWMSKNIEGNNPEL